MNQDLGKTHHRKSANNKGYLKNKERIAIESVRDSYAFLFLPFIQFRRKYTDWYILQNKAFAKQKQIQNTYLLLKIR